MRRATSCDAPALAELARLDDAAFRELFAGSPIKRIGRDRFVRNVMIAIGNSGDSALAAIVERLLDDGSPLVRGAAAWALNELNGRRARFLAAGRYPSESDPGVREEWLAVLKSEVEWRDDRAAERPPAPDAAGRGI